MNIVKFTPKIPYLNLQTKFFYQKLLPYELLRVLYAYSI